MTKGPFCRRMAVLSLKGAGALTLSFALLVTAETFTQQVSSWIHKTAEWLSFSFNLRNCEDPSLLVLPRGCPVRETSKFKNQFTDIAKEAAREAPRIKALTPIAAEHEDAFEVS